MNKTRTLTIFANLLLEVAASGNITEQQASQITSALGKIWKD